MREREMERLVDANTNVDGDAASNRKGGRSIYWV